MRKLSEIANAEELMFVVGKARYGIYPFNELKEQVANWLHSTNIQPNKPRVFIADATVLKLSAGAVIDYFGDDYWEDAYPEWELTVPPNLREKLQGVLDEIVAHDIVANTSYEAGEEVDVTDLINEIELGGEE